MVGISIGIKFTASRASGMPVFRIHNPWDGGWLHCIMPYFIPARIDGTTTFYFAYSNNNPPYFDAPITISANQIIRYSGVCFASVVN